MRLQEKQQINKINAEEKAKNDLWVTYKKNIQNKDYTAAGSTFQQIINTKKQLLVDITANNTILSNILITIKSK